MNAFNWKGQTSIFSRERKTAQVISLEPKRFHTHSLAVSSADRAIQAEIAQNNREMQRHMDMVAAHREQARKLAARNAALNNRKSPEYWAAVEAERGLKA